MDLLTLTGNPILQVAITVIAVFCGICALAWPWLVPHRARDRLTAVARPRVVADTKRHASKSEKRGNTVVQAKPSRILQNMVNLFKMAGKEEDGRLAMLLATAGYRGRAAIVKYLAARILTPFVFLALALIYIAVAPGDMSLLIKAAIVVGAVAAGYYLPTLMLRGRIAARQKEIGRAWPDAVDLLLICVETGMSIEHSFRKVAEEMAGNSLELAKELSLTTADLAYQQERRTAYENLARRTALDTVKAVTTCLVQSERYGTSLGLSLRVLAQESRDMRMAAAERKAAALPPKLTVPMIIFFLPVLFAVIITPAALQVSSN